MTEQEIQKQIITYLEKECNSYVVNVVKGSKSGIPDLICCVNSRFVAIEVKTPSTATNTSELQDYNIDLINRTGGLAFVATSVADVQRYLNPSPIDI